MSSELTPNQQLLLWHLGLRGGRALQMEVQYKEIADDRNELERRGLLKVVKKPRPYTLELKDGGWNELTKRSYVLPKARKPTRERAMLQLFLETLHRVASRQRVGIGEILRTPPDPSQSKDLKQRIRHAFFEIAGNPPQDSVRLSALRAKLHDVSRQQLDEALLAMKTVREINLMNLDNPRDIKVEEASALHDGSHHYHVLWIER